MRYRHRTIPDAGKALRSWVHSFSRLIHQDPQRYGLTADDATLILAEANNYLAAAILAERTSTRTKPAVRARNDARTRMLAVLRPYVALIKANPEVAVWDKTGLDLALSNRRKSPTPLPEHPPFMHVRGGGPLQHLLSFSEPGHEERRGKPKGVTHVVVLRAIGEYSVGHPTDAQYLGAFTRWPIRLSYQAPDAGKTVSYFGAWLMASGEQSAWSVPATLMLAGQQPIEPVLRCAA